MCNEKIPCARADCLDAQTQKQADDFAGYWLESVLIADPCPADRDDAVSENSEGES